MYALLFSVFPVKLSGSKTSAAKGEMECSAVKPGAAVGGHLRSAAKKNGARA